MYYRGIFVNLFIALCVAWGSALIQPHSIYAHPQVGAEPPSQPMATVVAAPLAAIGDYIWYDADGDGIEDVGEPGIANVQLALYRDDDGSGTISAGDTLVATTVTGADGGYRVGDERYIPDVAFVSQSRQPAPSRDAYNAIAPDLAVEVLSP
ncbi:MAG: SdrD B-like domain-containing protein, partial [Anaerolineae bacterium]